MTTESKKSLENEDPKRVLAKRLREANESGLTRSLGIEERLDAMVLAEFVGFRNLLRFRLMEDLKVIAGKEKLFLSGQETDSEAESKQVLQKRREQVLALLSALNNYEGIQIVEK